MSKYQIAQIGLHPFRVVETRPGGFWRIVGRFETRALAEAWIVNQTGADHNRGWHRRHFMAWPL
jgi:hypothetical protein